MAGFRALLVRLQLEYPTGDALCCQARTLYDMRGKSYLHPMARLGISQHGQAFADLLFYDTLYWRQNNFLRMDRKGCNFSFFRVYSLLLWNDCYCCSDGVYTSKWNYNHLHCQLYLLGGARVSGCVSQMSHSS
ncbi:hypothetical protein ATANTOWER_023048 [Ataeniobius toweri]|uniref:Uncharacterized protein n=1 Tax=Ataeniobius toweri TaxID=208326 RepID=A0ABU7BHU1_9TELE|nr:hypothetical protein [Ataeniobius toweri]